MIPIADDNLERTQVPFVNYLLILVNIVVFVYYQQMGQNQAFTFRFSLIPQEILSGQDVINSAFLGEKPVPIFLSIFTSMFMHAGVSHLAGNMLFLWVFGDNLEDRMGHLRYLFFFLLCGLVATLCHVFVSMVWERDLLVPTIGASGAISGVMGAYLWLFPKNEVTVIVIAFIMKVPAYVTLGLWFLFQFISVSSGFIDAQSSRVAYSAHIGGFLAGLLLVHLFAPRH